MTLHKAKRHLRGGGRILARPVQCPCASCNGLFLQTPTKTVDHLYLVGYSSSFIVPFEEEYADEWAGAPPQDDRNLGHPALLAREDWEPSASDEDSEDNGDEKEEELELSQREKTIKACMLLSRQLIDEIANGGVHQTSAVRVLTLFKHHLGPLLSDDVMDELPDSLHMLKKVAELVEVSSFMRHFCPEGCRMFVGASGQQEKCGLCQVGWRYDDHGRPM